MADAQTGFAEINGANLYYEVAGEGQPFVMVHAGIANKSQWDSQFDFFAKHYKVVRYDMRGYGQSQPVQADYQRHEDLRAAHDFVSLAGHARLRAHVVLRSEHSLRVGLLRSVTADKSTNALPRRTWSNG